MVAARPSLARRIAKQWGATMSTLTYQLLLELYRGQASVVENLTYDQREALRVETPLARFIEGADADGSPRHVVLTGNAGDGKTFAALQAKVQNLHAIYDASAGPASSTSKDPVTALADDLRARLARGERLLLAINRGQLERLEAQAARADDDLARLVRTVVERSQMRAAWTDAHADDVAVVDLGLFDSTSAVVINAMLDKVAAVDLSATSKTTQAAASAARDALKTPAVRRWIERVLAEVASRGGHLTMRQLWSLIAFLVTGGRAPNDDAPLTIRESVGARLFAYESAAPEFESALAAVDPALTPHPEICRAVLLREAVDRARMLPGLQPLCEDESLDDDGVAITRALVVHDDGQTPPALHDNYRNLLRRLEPRPPGWVGDMRSITKALLEGVYRALGLWRTGTWFPAWQTLCYDSYRARIEQGRSSEVAAVASAVVDTNALQIALPRCHPTGAEALRGAWRSPYIWLRFERPNVAGAQDALRITPRLFRALYDDDRRALAEMTPSELLTLERWLGRAPQTAHGDGVRIARAGGQTPLTVRVDDLSEKTRAHWENADGNR